jgi:hypothetical protein
MLVEIIQRLDRRSDQQVYRELLRDLQRVEGKIQILFRVAEVVFRNPNDDLPADWGSVGAVSPTIRSSVCRWRPTTLLRICAAV